MEHHHNEGLVFFTDLARFTALTRGMDPDGLADFLVAYATIVSRTISAAGGQVIKYVSDSALGFFPGNDVDRGVLALLETKRIVESELSFPDRKVNLKIGAHYGPVVMPVLPPFSTLDIFGETVNITIGLGEGGTTVHRDKMIISATAFRKLAPETRKQFHKFTEPIVYLAEG